MTFGRNIFTALLLITSLGLAQQQVPLPRVDYAKYGSLEAQLTVYRRLQLEADRTYENRLRLARERVERLDTRRYEILRDRNSRCRRRLCNWE